jgi:ABC-2 type transport system permease protein
MRPLAKLTWVELKLFVREPFALIFTFAFPVIVLVVLAGVFGSEPDDEAFGGLIPSDYYLAGYVAVVIAAIGLVALPVHVATYRERGILRRFRASSVPAWNVLGAQVVVGLVMAIAGTIVLVIVGRLVYDAALPEASGRVGVAFTLSTLAFLAIGFLVAGVTRNARAAQSLGMILFFPMWLLSGAGPPPDVLTEGMRRVSDAMPLTYAVRALQDPWLGAGSGTADLIRLAVVAVVAGTLSVMTLRSA